VVLERRVKIGEVTDGIVMELAPMLACLSVVVGQVVSVDRLERLMFSLGSNDVVKKGWTSGKLRRRAGDDGSVLLRCKRR
jgi:hypothetical protein